ncbi:MAG: GCN5-related N-acetyltransferase [Pontixanthobacter sp.]
MTGYIDMASADLVKEWNRLTKVDMPALATEREWPVHLDHCFQRILLDSAVGAKWRDVIASPAYKNASDTQLSRAIAYGREVIAGRADLHDLNRNSLEWRGKL